MQYPNCEHVWPLQHGLAASHASPRFLHGGGGGVVEVVVDVVVDVVVVDVVVVDVVGGESLQNSLAVFGFMHRCRRQQTSLPGVPQQVCCSSKISQHAWPGPHCRSSMGHGEQTSLGVPGARHSERRQQT